MEIIKFTLQNMELKFTFFVKYKLSPDFKIINILKK